MLRLPSASGLFVSPCQSFVVALGRQVAIVDLRSGTRIASWPTLANAVYAAISPSGRFFAVKDTSGSIVARNIADGEIVARHQAIHDEGAALHYSGDDGAVVDGSWSGHLRIRNATDLTIMREFAFPDEMIKQVSPSQDRELWLVVHQPKTPPGENFSPPPYFSVWQWPMDAPLRTIAADLDHVDTAVLSPCASFIAVAGYCRPLQSTLFRLLSLDGGILAEIPLETWVTGIRWSPCGRQVGILDRNGVRIFECPTLRPVSTHASERILDFALLKERRAIWLCRGARGPYLAFASDDIPGEPA